MLNEFQYKCKRTKQCILTLLTTEPRDEDGETGRQVLSNKTTERGLYSAKREGRNPGRISQHVRVKAGVTGPGVEGVNY